MNRRRVALVAVLLVTLFVGIFDHDLWTPDEPRAAELGREFLDHSSWAVPTLNDRPFVEKPPLVYWTIAASLKIFGLHDWAARLPAALFAGGTLLFAGLLARALYGGEAAAAALLVLATTVGFLVPGHHVESDAGLLFFVTASAYFLWRAIEGSAAWYGAAMLAVLGAFFSKGFLGLVLPGLHLGGWILWSRTPRELLRARPWIWLPLLAAPITLWLCALLADPRGDLLHTFLIENHLRRFLGGVGNEDRDHQHAVYYYVLLLPVALLPWTPAFFWAAPRVWSRRQERPERFLLSWVLPGLLFLSAAGTKRAIYLAPILPPLAILVAERLASSSRRPWLEPAVCLLTLFMAAAWIPIVRRVDSTRSFKPFCRELGARLPPQAPLLGFDLDETGLAVMPFYTGRYVVPLKTREDLDRWVQSGARNLVFLTVDVRGATWHSAEVQARFPHLLLAMPADRTRRMQAFGLSPGSP